MPRHAAVMVAFLAAIIGSGCTSLGRGWLEKAKLQCRQAMEEMRGDMAVLDSENDGLDAFSPADAKHLRAARAEMEQNQPGP
jgi:hypothetical protein